MNGPVPAEALHYERFKHRSQLDGEFECGNQGLNDFINNDDEVFKYGKENLARTILVREESTWEVVAFYSTSAHSVHVTHAKRSPKVRPDYSVEYLPSLLIGRLAVKTGWQSRSIGAHLVTKIAIDSLDSDHCAFRLLVLSSEPDSVTFYKRMGFDYLEGRRYKKHDKPMMFLDLAVLADDLGLRTDHGAPVKVAKGSSKPLH